MDVRLGSSSALAELQLTRASRNVAEISIDALRLLSNPTLPNTEQFQRQFNLLSMTAASQPSL